jgi:hypothetical protein
MNLSHKGFYALDSYHSWLIGTSLKVASPAIRWACITGTNMSQFYGGASSGRLSRKDRPSVLGAMCPSRVGKVYTSGARKPLNKSGRGDCGIFHRYGPM